ncbi:MAG: hypothetical protein ABSD98_05105 [Candidatus Korobacteraceae bacterium]
MPLVSRAEEPEDWRDDWERYEVVDRPTALRYLASDFSASRSDLEEYSDSDIIADGTEVRWEFVKRKFDHLGDYLVFKGLYQCSLRRVSDDAYQYIRQLITTDDLYARKVREDRKKIAQDAAQQKAQQKEEERKARFMAEGKCWVCGLKLGLYSRSKNRDHHKRCPDVIFGRRYTIDKVHRWLAELLC